MKYLLLLFLMLFSSLTFAQGLQKGRMYAYWGWNRSAYTDSDISFSGKDYEFTLDNVVGKDRQSKFELSVYFNPTTITIPQYNFRMGYFFRDNWEISLGMDHMKYVMKADQKVAINGHIDIPNGSFNGSYSGEKIELTPSFLAFEHTDGLNFLNTELRHWNHLFTYSKLSVYVGEGLGLGVLIPRTNTTLLGKERYDEFHLAGFGLDAVAAVQIMLFDRYFVQTEGKGGFIYMPSIRTTKDPMDKASQNFFFSQINIVFGAYFNLLKEPAKK